MVMYVTVKQLHREYLRAGADVMQAFTFYASDDKLANRGNQASKKLTVSFKIYNWDKMWEKSATYRRAQLEIW